MLVSKQNLFLEEKPNLYFYLLLQMKGMPNSYHRDPTVCSVPCAWQVNAPCRLESEREGVSVTAAQFEREMGEQAVNPVICNTNHTQ